MEMTGHTSAAGLIGVPRACGAVLASQANSRWLVTAFVEWRRCRPGRSIKCSIGVGGYSMRVKFSSGRLLHTVVAGECSSISVVVSDDDGCGISISAFPPLIELTTLTGRQVAMLRSSDVEISGDDDNVLSFELPAAAVDQAGLLHINVVDRRSGESVGRCLLLVTPAV